MDGKNAGLDAVCLTGAITRGLADQMSSHDIDEAASMLIFGGHAASDASGKAGPNGFDRLQAFSAGIPKGADGCRPYAKV